MLAEKPLGAQPHRRRGFSILSAGFGIHHVVGQRRFVGLMPNGRGTDTLYFTAGTRACLQSSRPEDDGNEVDHSSEAGIGLFVAGGDASKRLDGAEEVLDEMAPLVFFRVMRGVSSGPLAQWNDSLGAVRSQPLAQPVSIERLVADDGKACDAVHESIEACDVVTLARQQQEAHRIAECIDEGCNLRRQAAARFADRLIASPPFAPVPC
jgi:hypothetical protein